jgi:hypothetical protein
MNKIKEIMERFDREFVHDVDQDLGLDLKYGTTARNLKSFLRTALLSMVDDIEAKLLAVIEERGRIKPMVDYLEDLKKELTP